jgi:hypothetical protein
MAMSTVFAVAFAVVGAVLILASLGFVFVHKRTDRRRVEAGDIRDRAAEQSHEVGQREGRADLNQEHRRADTIDPDSQNGDTSREVTPARDTRRGTPVDSQSPRAIPRSG